MHKIKSIFVSGFRRQQRNIRLDLSADANFLIGRNGTGKTSLINLINACLSIDVSVLKSVVFDEVVIKLKETGKISVPSIEIKRENSTKYGLQIFYLLRENASSGPETFTVYSGRRRNIARDTENFQILVNRGSNIRGLRDRLSSMIHHTWLSLHRGQEIYHEVPVDEYEHEMGEILPGVDVKLNDVLQRIRQFYFTLDKQVSDLTRQFQKDWFLSFLTSEISDADVIEAKIDFAEEAKAIAAIFNRFELPPEKFEQQLEKHVELGKKSLESLKNRDQFRISEFFNVYDVLRLHKLVEQWQELQERQKEILEPKTKFLKIASEMLYQKKIFLTQGNEIFVETIDKFEISVNNLSSGEKQLLIFLAETILQQEDECVFLADEPELSLHIEWQEQLVPNLLSLNPNAQVLFATHSPDIVGSYNDRVFSMEEFIS